MTSQIKSRTAQHVGAKFRLFALALAFFLVEFPIFAQVQDKSLLVVVGENYQATSKFPFFIDPGLRGELEAAGWKVGECRWSELTTQTASNFRVLVFLQTPNLPSLDLASNPLFQKMQSVTSTHLAAGGSVVIFADQFRGRIQPVLDAWLFPYGMRVSSYQLTVTGPTNRFEGYPSFSWTQEASVPANAPFLPGMAVGVPQDNDLSFLLRYDGNWQSFLTGPVSSVPMPAKATGLAPGETPWSGPFTMVAGRVSGRGKLVVCGSHSSFWVLNPYHEVWDNGALMEAGGLDFVKGLLGWASITVPNGPGGFSGGIVDARQDRAEDVKNQRGTYPETARRGVIGVDPGPSSSNVGALSNRARALGLDYLVFTANGTSASSVVYWDQLVAACEAASGNGFRALPGVAFASPETRNQAVAFNLKKPWPEIPWQSGAYESLVRVGVNNDFDSMLVLRNPESAPVPIHNAGAVCAVEVNSKNGAHVMSLLRSGWPVLPVRVANVKTLQELDGAAATPTTLHVSSGWSNLGAAGYEKITKTSVGSGTIRRFEVESSSAWPSDGLLRASVRFSADGLAGAGSMALYAGERMLIKVPVVSGAVDIVWNGVLPGWTQFHVEGVGEDGSTTLLASPLAVSQAEFATSIGSDLMNGYLYPAQRSTASTPGAVRVSGAYARVGTTVYPQLGWGGHWLFRTLNQQAEPLGFEIGSPAGGIQRFSAGYRWRQSGTIHSLAPRRSVAINSAGVVVWRDLNVVLKKETTTNGNRTIWNEAVPGVSASMRTTAFRWWEHAALLFEPKATVSANSSAWAEKGNIAQLSLNEDFNAAGAILLRHNGQTSTLPLAGEIVLPAGAGVSLGDRPSGMVSLWSLSGNLRFRVVQSSGRPLLELWQDAVESTAREAAFLLVVSEHRPGTPTTLAEVESAIFQGRHVYAPNNALGRFVENLDVSRTRGFAATLKGQGDFWRARVAGLSRDSEAAVWWSVGGKARREIIPSSDIEASLPVLAENIPATRVFVGNTFTANRTGLRIWMIPASNDSDAWTILAHNPKSVAESVSISTHPSLAGIVAPWTANTTLAPGETKSWTHLPHVPLPLRFSGGTLLGSLPLRIGPATVSIAASGGNGSLSWALTSGSLPAGMTLNASTGALSGTPQNLGWSSFRITVADQSAATVSRDFLFITHPAGNQTLARPLARVGADYRSTLADSGFTRTGSGLDYSKISGPAWLAISANGSLSGTPAVEDPGANAFGVAVFEGTREIFRFTLAVEVAKRSQTLSPFVAPANRVFSTNPIPFVAPVASSGLPVLVTVKSGNATISGGNLVPGAAGTIVLAANQAGNSTFAPAPEVLATFVLSKLRQIISTPPTIPAINGSTPPFSLQNLQATSGLPVVWSVKSGNATVSNNILTPIGTGMVVVAANQAGNAFYNAAPEVRAYFQISAAAQSIPPLPLFPRQNQGTSLAVSTPVTSAGLTSILTVKSGNATLESGRLHFHSPGKVVLASNHPGTSLLLPALERTRVIEVGAPLEELVVEIPNPALGSVPSDFAGRTLREIGSELTIAATPAPGMRLQNWLKNGVTVSASRSLVFVMESGLRLEALFAPNFGALTGHHYIALVGDGSVGTQSPEDQALFPSRNGFLQVVLSSNGNFTANLTLNGKTHLAAGFFGNSTATRVTIPRPGEAPAVLDLELNPVLPGEISGTLEAGNGELDFRALRAQWRGNSSTHPLAGRSYRFEVTGGQPDIHRFGILTVQSTGAATLQLTMENGLPVSIGGSFVDDNASSWIFPFHRVLPNGLVQGEIVVAKSNSSQVSGNMEWLGRYIPQGGTAQIGFLWQLAIGRSTEAGSSSGPVATGSSDTLPFRLHLPEGLSTTSVGGTWSGTSVVLADPTAVPGLSFSVNSAGIISGSYQMLLPAGRQTVAFRGWSFPAGLSPSGLPANTIGVGHVVTPNGAYPFTITTP